MTTMLDSDKLFYLTCMTTYEAQEHTLTVNMAMEQDNVSTTTHHIFLASRTLGQKRSKASISIVLV